MDDTVNSGRATSRRAAAAASNIPPVKPLHAKGRRMRRSAGVERAIVRQARLEGGLDGDQGIGNSCRLKPGVVNA
ncbi:hypothetical protein M2360_005300 [Rhizobium sp. SG_E_25_P2]|uniref:hypothetical protein n=1 Tax=Rhizobium sp. SG_E_25_P2 TaxID=2879942 RepID=UPI0024742702|nr:hypothetical protein [Rhizobium sp. SG_E_25_P2]MDH6269868.1 hypothetical protein [Rhizobium sp. SG_E_25_P2]